MKVTNSNCPNQFKRQQLVIEFDSQIEVDSLFALFNTHIVADILRDADVTPSAIRENILKMYPDTSKGGFLMIRNDKLEPIR